MATGRVDVPRRGEFYGHSKKHYRNGTLDGKSSRVHDHGINHLNGYHVSPSERDLAIQHKKEYHVPSNGLQSRPLRVEAAKEDDVQMPPEKKRKFSPIIWDVEDHRSRISSRNRIAPVATALSPPRSVVVVSNVVSDRATEYSATENQVNGLEFSSVKPQVVEPLEIVFPLVDHEHNVDNDREEGQLEEEEVQAPNIATSRWASDSDSPRHMSLSGDEDRPRNGRWVRRSLTPESGECQREDSEGHRSKLSGSGGKCYANGDESENEFESENFIDVDQDSGESSVLDLLELDAEEPTVVTQGGMNMLQSSRSVFEYEKLNKISEGTYGVVYRARDKMTGEIVALKKVKMNVGREDEYGFPLTSLREVNILLSFNHPSIVNVKEVVVDNVDNVFMVMEHVEHDLKGLMSRMKQPFSTSEVKCLMLQLLEGVSYLHNNWVIHRDLKPSNLLLNNKGELKLCDFGMSRQYGSPCKSYTQLVVTQWYRAPELLLGAKQYSTAIDMWSVGCIMAELLLKEPLFQGKGGSDIDQLHKIFAILGTPSEMIWPAFSGLTRAKVNFVKQPYNLLRKKFPVTSFTGSPVLSDLGLDLLNELLCYDPEKRITADAALDHDWFREVPLPKSKDFMPTFPPKHA